MTISITAQTQDIANLRSNLTSVGISIESPLSGIAIVVNRILSGYPDILSVILKVIPVDILDTLPFHACVYVIEIVVSV